MLVSPWFLAYTEPSKGLPIAYTKPSKGLPIAKKLVGSYPGENGTFTNLEHPEDGGKDGDAEMEAHFRTNLSKFHKKNFKITFFQKQKLQKMSLGSFFTESSSVREEVFLSRIQR